MFAAERTANIKDNPFVKRTAAIGSEKLWVVKESNNEKGSGKDLRDNRLR